LDAGQELERVKRKNQTLSRAIFKLQTRFESLLKLLSVITRLTAIPLQASDLTTAADQVLDVLVQEYHGIDGCSILIYRVETGRLELLTANGSADRVGEPERPHNRNLAFLPGEGVAGRVFADNIPFFWNPDPGLDGFLKKDLELATPESLACLPLSLPEGPIGVLNISFGAPRPFDQPRQRDLTVIGGAAANVIQTFILRAEIEDKNACLLKAHNELEQRVKERTAALAAASEKLKQDIAERIRTEEALLESEQRYRSFVENNPNGIFIYELPSGRIVYLNSAICAMLGMSMEEGLGKTPWDIIHPKDFAMLRQRFNAISRNEPVSNSPPRPYTFVRKDGSSFRGEVTVSLISFQGKKAVQGVLRDVTSQERLEMQLRQAQKLEAVGTLSSGIAHDFNNILQAITGYLQLIKRQGEVKEPIRRYVHEIDRAADRAAELVQGLLTFTHRTPAELKPSALNRIVDSAVRILERTIPKMIEVEARLADDLKPVMADGPQLEQVVINLGSNARDAMPDGGHLLIQTRPFELRDEDGDAYPGLAPGGYAVLSVSDTGQGIDPETQKHIYEPFFTTKEVGQGTGLGLSIIYGIVTAHGGHIACRSEPAEGTTFEIFFPVLVPAATPDITPPQPAAQDLSGHETILLVDDEVPILEIGQEFLESHGYRILTAENGLEALEVFKARHDEIDLVVLDLGMPKMSGEACLTALLNIDPRARILIASGYLAKGESRPALLAKASDFINKPYRLRDLLQKVRTILET